MAISSEKSYTSDTRCGIMKLDERAIAAINSVLAVGHRAEVIPTKDGVRVMHVKRETVKEEPKTEPIIAACPTWTRRDTEVISWQCSGCGYITPDSLRPRVCPSCKKKMFLGIPEDM